MSKRTGGKWFAGEAFEAKIGGCSKCRMIGIGNGSVHIGYVSITSLVPKEEAIANARLIVHASDLLDACERALEYVETGNRRTFGIDKILKAAIAKATKGNES